MELYLTSLTTAIGRNAKYGLWAVIARLTILCILAGSIGICLGLGFSTIKLPIPISTGRFLLSVIFLSQISIVALLFGAANFIRRDTFNSLLLTLPISSCKRCISWLIPDLTISLLGMLLIAFPVITIFHNLGLRYATISFGLLIGIVSGFGITYGLAFRKYKATVTMCVIGVQFFLIQNIFGESQLLDPKIATPILIGCFTISVAAIWRISHTIEEASQHNKSSHDVIPLPFPSKNWMIRKIVRNKRMLSSLSTTFLLSSGLAVFARQQDLDATLLLPFAAIISAASMSDLRSMSKAYNPAEICATKGTLHFERQSWWGILGCSMAVTPLLWVILASHYAILPIVSSLMLGFGAAIVASTIIIAEGRDILAQFATMCLTVTLFIGLPKLLSSYSYSEVSQCLIQILLTSVLLIISYAVEYHRNPYSWR